MPGAIFLGGGGDEKASKIIDNKFVKTISKKGIEKLIYIPIAISSIPYPKCLSWFTSIFGNHNFKIDMWVDLEGKSLTNLEDKVSVYIGGGNTEKLLRVFKKTGFDKKLKSFSDNGGVIYGGSAGAIILGKDIRTAPEAKGAKDTQGLGLLLDYSVSCHFQSKKPDFVNEITRIIDSPVIAIEENSGILCANGVIKPIGPGNSYLFPDGVRV